MRVLETRREEQDLCDKDGIRHHHRYRTEQILEVHRKLSSTSIARIQSDKHCCGESQWDLVGIKKYRREALSDRILDLNDDLREEC